MEHPVSRLLVSASLGLLALTSCRSRPTDGSSAAPPAASTTAGGPLHVGPFEFEDVTVRFGTQPAEHSFHSPRAYQEATLELHAVNTSAQVLAPNTILLRCLDARGAVIPFYEGTSHEHAVEKLGSVRTCAPGARCVWSIKHVWMPVDAAVAQAIAVEACPPAADPHGHSSCSSGWGFGDPVFKIADTEWPANSPAAGYDAHVP